MPVTFKEGGGREGGGVNGNVTVHGTRVPVHAHFFCTHTCIYTSCVHVYMYKSIYIHVCISLILLHALC